MPETTSRTDTTSLGIGGASNLLSNLALSVAYRTGLSTPCRPAIMTGDSHLDREYL
jgi:hypothetical protein